MVPVGYLREALGGWVRIGAIDLHVKGGTERASNPATATTYEAAGVAAQDSKHHTMPRSTHAAAKSTAVAKFVSRDTQSHT